jgi:signal transduction histidine kinase
MLRRLVLSIVVLLPIFVLSFVLYRVETRHRRIIADEGRAIRTLQATSDATHLLDAQRQQVVLSAYVPLRPNAIRLANAQFVKTLSDPSLGLGPGSRTLIREIIEQERDFSAAALDLPPSPTIAEVVAVEEQAANVTDLLSTFRAQHRVNLSALFATEQEQLYLSIVVLLIANGGALVLIFGALTLWERLGRSRAEAEALRATEQLRSEFVAFAAHELRNPVSAIKMGASLLQDRLDVDAATRGAVITSIGRTADTLSRVTLNLLNIGRVEAGQLRLQRQAVSLRGLVDELVGERAAYESDIETRVYRELPDIRVNVDQEFIKLVISNLLDNAIKFSPPGSPVCITAEAADSRAVVHVRDSGRGIPPEMLPHIFEKYETSHAPDRTRRGMGLGLYMARLLLEAHGGTIWAESKVGQGTTISFTLPVEGE